MAGKIARGNWLVCNAVIVVICQPLFGAATGNNFSFAIPGTKNKKAPGKTEANNNYRRAEIRKFLEYLKWLYIQDRKM